MKNKVMQVDLLKETERQMHQILMHQEARDQYADGEGVFARANVADQAVHDGIELYARLIANGRRSLFASIYPLAETLLGKKFDALIQAFRESNKATHYNFNRQAQGLAQFVEANKNIYATRYPFLSERIEYEWLELQVIEHEGDLPPASHCAKDHHSPEEYAALSVQLNPTLIGVDFDYPIQDLIESIQSGEKLPRRFKKSPCHMVFLRDRDDDQRVVQLGPIARGMIARCRAKTDLTVGELLVQVLQDRELSEHHGSDLENLLSIIDDLSEMQAIFLV